MVNESGGASLEASATVSMSQTMQGQGDDDQDWQFDEFNDGVMKSVKTIHKQQLSKFVDDFSRQLDGISSTMGSAIDQMWDSDDCFQLKYDNEENCTLEQIYKDCTPNADLNKCLMVLSALCVEIKGLKETAKEKYYPGLLFYGEDLQSLTEDHEASDHEKITKFLPFIIDFSKFLYRCQSVFKNFMLQLAACYPASGSKSSLISSMKFMSLMEHLAVLLGILVQLDEIVKFNRTLREHWDMYKRMIQSITQSPAMFDTQSETVLPLEKWLVEFDGEIFDAMIFSNCITQNIENSGQLFLHNKNLKEQFATAIEALISWTESRLNGGADFMGRLWMTSLVLLYVLHYELFRDFDARVNKQVWDLLKKVPGINLIGPTVWCAPEFILDWIPQAGKTLDRKVLAAIDSIRQSTVKEAPSTLPKQINFFTLAVTQWQSKFEDAIVRAPTKPKTIKLELESKIKVCQSGLMLARQISVILRTQIPLHSDSGQQMGAKVALQLMRLIELLKTIQLTFNRHQVYLKRYFPQITQDIQSLLIVKLKIMYEKVQDKKNAEVAAAAAALKTAIKLYAGAATSRSMTCCDLILNYTFQKLRSKLMEEEITSVLGTCKLLTSVINFPQNLKDACDCTFFQWGRACFPVYLKAMLNSKLKPNTDTVSYCPTNSGVPLLFSALKDIADGFAKCEYFPDDLKAAFKREILSEIDTCLLAPLCVEIETDLRYMTHLHLKVKAEANPVKTSLIANDFKPLLQMPPIRFMDGYINIPERVSMHLNKVFYNLTTIMPQDWQAYTAMKFCAQSRYGLELLDSKLPQQTLEQGLDVLEIMRNIHLFVGQYLYNLNNQIFVEQATANRHLNTINITHIANSMRTHGTGIMNTTVNYTFQYLTKQFRIFSQFLYDEQIKGKLIKEIRYFREKKDEIDQMYPYERAEKFNKNIRRLGLSKDKLSYLDEFRKLISQIGNAMGFVRMIRSGGLSTCSRAIEFVPDLDDIVSFEEEVTAESLSEESVQAAKNLDCCIGNLSKNFAEGTDYFQLFVSVFSPEFRKAKNVHLKNFYIITPALMINFVEHIKQAKEQMMKKNKNGALFTDDGFAMGVAFILALLDQSQDFDSLHWFDSVRFKLKTELEAAQAKQKSFTAPNANREDQKQAQAADLTFRRIDMYQKEFDLLSFSFSSARIFFQQAAAPTDSDNEDDFI